MTKHLLPVYNKPMIYYPLSVLLECDIRRICLICSPVDLSVYQRLLGDGDQWGISLAYVVQERPRGIAEGLLIASDFLAGSSCTLVLGDNIFYGGTCVDAIRRANERPEGATIFGYRVRDPERYGVVEFNADGSVGRIVEKPAKAPSNIAVTGIYSYDHMACHYASQLRPSRRGELEITDLNNIYLSLGTLQIEILGTGSAWLDTGTHESLLEASEFVRAVEHRQGVGIACLEEIAYRKGFIGSDQIERAISRYGDGSYVDFLKSVIDGEH